jgi:two-component system sensor histidine kinase KdpD
MAIAWRRAVSRWLRRRAAGYLLAGALVALISVAIGAVPFGSALSHRAPIYLLAVLAAGALLGRGPAVLASLLSFLAFNWFFVEPIHTFTVVDAKEWQALLLFLAAALVTGQLTALLRARAEAADRREREAVALYEVGKALVGAASADAALVAGTDRLQASLGLTVCDVLLADGPDGSTGPHLRSVKGLALATGDLATAQWVLAHGQAASRGWTRASGGGRRLVRLHGQAPPARAGGRAPAGAAFLPLAVEGRPVGVLYAVARGGTAALSPAEHRLLAAACDQFALSVERGRLQREAVNAEVLARTDELRAALLSSVSHDLRMPLAAIKAAAGSLLQQEVGWDEAARNAFAAQIEREADRLNRLVENLLSLSRIEAGALVLDRQWYPIGELIADTVARLEPVLANHRVDVAVPDTLPPVPLDYLLIQQVVANLLENAAKYAPPGTRIRVAAEAAGDRVRVRVENEGPGLPPWERERVFERFYRVPGAVSPDGAATAAAAPGPGRPPAARGTGLGLAVCAGFVGAHGGRIWVETPARVPAVGGDGYAMGQAAPRGAVFVFELPLEPPPAPTERRPAAPVGAGAAGGALGAGGRRATRAARVEPSDGDRRAAEVFRPRRPRRPATA